jgi:hypothetical protein
MGHSFHTQTHMHRADLAAQLGYGGYGAPSFGEDEDMFAGAPPACAPNEFWDEAHQACVPVALPMPSTTSPAQCPPGQFFDYFKQTCVAAAQPHAAGALADVTIGPHLISPLGWPYAWGQAAGLWGGRDAPPAPDPRRDDRYPGDRGGGTGNPDWATVALVGIGVVGVLGLGYLLVRR